MNANLDTARTIYLAITILVIIVAVAWWDFRAETVQKTSKSVLAILALTTVLVTTKLTDTGVYVKLVSMAHIVKMISTCV